MSIDILRKLGEELVRNEIFHNEYLDALVEIYENGNIKLLIIGLDPFPNDPIGIHFCKNSWAKMKNGSGYIVFNSILDLETHIELNDSPKDLVINLAREGVILLNSSYRLLKNLKGEAKENAKKEGFEFNKLFIDKVIDQHVICLGKGYTFTKKYLKNNSKLIKVYHPATYHFKRGNPLWKDYWNKGCLKSKFDL
ncbi:hypothetical protein [Acinetobacter modestus]|uniref:hypothetical protein n=1 Tax=Acinetobacter modestus TaxID=1776740 RepID=UPI001F4B50E8|nr:hypothetical protein [Acinetobacter modestus]MCH7333858.1 hypothetical protein [Acinetobacter modestus]